MLIYFTGPTKPYRKISKPKIISSNSFAGYAGLTEIQEDEELNGSRIIGEARSEGGEDHILVEDPAPDGGNLLKLINNY